MGDILSDTMPHELKPFGLYWRTRQPGDLDGPFPAIHPFAFAWEPDTGLVRQRVSPALADLLRRLYGAGSNIGYLRDDHVLAHAYGEDFLRFLLDAHHRIGGVRDALEIGCGGGYLMRRLGDHGIRVRGVDPSPIATAAAARHGLDVQQGFFPGPMSEARRDFVYHMDVLEHVLDLTGFLAAHHQALTDEGHVAISVPDCGPSIDVGDLGMVIHQHVSFFTATSLEAVLTTHGFDVMTIERARVGGSLYALARRRPASPRRSGAARPEPGDHITPNGHPRGAPMTETARTAFETFWRRVVEGQRRVESYLTRPPCSVGIWVPIRALAYLHAEADWRHVRLFDDDPNLRGRRLDGLAQGIEGPEDFRRDPPDRVLVMSLTYGDRIKATLEATAPRRVEVTTLRALLMGS